MNLDIAERPAAAAHTRSVISPGCRTRVLIVGAHPQWRSELRRFLLAQPDVATVAVAASAREGLAAVRDRPINLAVVDARLSDRDGLSLTRQLHNLLHPARILICAASPIPDSPLPPSSQAPTDSATSATGPQRCLMPFGQSRAVS